MLDQVIRKIQALDAFKAVTHGIRGRKNLSLEGLWGSSENIITASLIEYCRTLDRPVYIIVPDADTFHRTADDLLELQVFLHDPEKNQSLLFFPDDGHKPYDERESPVSVRFQRQECLEKLIRPEIFPALVTAGGLFKRLPSPEYMRSYEIRFQAGATYDFKDLGDILGMMGYERQDIVDQAGTYAIRGGIIDVYPYGREQPLRIEFNGNEVETVREFDLFTQRSLRTISDACIYPENATAQASPASENSLLTDYFHPDGLLVFYEPDLVNSQMDAIESEIHERYQYLRKTDHAIPLPEIIYAKREEITNRLNGFQQVHLCRLSGRIYETVAFEMQSADTFGGHLKILRETLAKNTAAGLFTYILCDDKTQAQRLEEILEYDSNDTAMAFSITHGELQEGFYDIVNRLAIYTDHQIFGRIKRVRPVRKFRSAQALRHLQTLKPGDYVVHIDHGIARFAGLEKVTSGDHTEECLKLLYHGNDKLYVPLEHFARVQKFTGEEGVEPRLNKLGSADWERLKTRTKKSIKDIAGDLIKLYAERKAGKGFAFSPDGLMQYELEAAFEFEDTPDQAKVTAEIKQDMESGVPMDRLVCGDVGYGKTEVALRVAFKAVQDSKQVAILVPTTILAEQHYETLMRRMKEFPVNIDVLSRFKTPKQQKQILEKLERGELDIVIGTHRLLSADVKFKDLGLLIVDEEQRFGVAHKEKLKKIKATVDTLTLTATPIPRTLHFSLMGGRDLSLIQTPPQDRLPVKTEITQFDEKLIHQAVMKEIHRGGQVYYVHNRVQSIGQVAATVQAAVPAARIAIVHGQMTPHRVEDVIHKFLKKEYDVLLATTIIENGIDIPNVNTIIIDHAHQYGLAQLYQLRGRVGRSNAQAYCYLLTPPLSRLPQESLRRLQAIEEYTELGSGFRIAMRDLEIRGAGNLLGAEQSGFINAVGFELYCRIVDEAIGELKSEQGLSLTPDSALTSPPREIKTRVIIHADTFLPDDYVNVSAERIRIYKQLSDIRSHEELTSLEQELRDRFGPLPTETQNLIRSVEIKILADAFGAERIDIDENKYILSFHADGSGRHNDTSITDKIDLLLSRVPQVKFRQSASRLDAVIGLSGRQSRENTGESVSASTETLHRVIRDLKNLIN